MKITIYRTYISHLSLLGAQVEFYQNFLWSKNNYESLKEK